MLVFLIINIIQRKEQKHKIPPIFFFFILLTKLYLANWLECSRSNLFIAAYTRKGVYNDLYTYFVELHKKNMYLHFRELISFLKYYANLCFHLHFSWFSTVECILSIKSLFHRLKSMNEKSLYSYKFVCWKLKTYVPGDFMR